MPKQITCPGCSKKYLITGFEDEQAKLVNTAVERFAEQIIRVLDNPEKDFTASYGSQVLNECLEKVLEARNRAFEMSKKKTQKKSFWRFLKKALDKEPEKS